MSEPRYVASFDKIIVRLPDGMRERLNELASVNGRSANAEAVQALQAWLLPGHQTEPAFVRLTDRLWHLLGRAARRNKRGIVEEIVARLDATFADAPFDDRQDGAPDLRAQIHSAMQDAVADLFADPERMRQLGYTRTKPSGDDPVSG